MTFAWLMAESSIESITDVPDPASVGARADLEIRGHWVKCVEIGVNMIPLSLIYLS